jgi:hypothetical protein
MPDFNVRSDSVNVEQIMEQIRARIREKRGVDYTEQQIRELATVKLEKFLDPRVRSDLLDQFRKAQPAYEPPALPNFAFEESTLFESHRAPIRWIRKLLRPLLKLLFNPNPLIQALNIQARLNTMNAEREAKHEAARRAMDPLYYELIHNLVVETTRMGIEVKNLKMRLESVSSRLEFNERRARALESAVVYKPAPEEAVMQRAPAAAVQQPRATPPPVAYSRPFTPAPTQAPAQTGSGQGSPAGGPSRGPGAGVPGEGPGQRSRRRRRRRGRRGGGPAAGVMGGPGAGAPVTQDESSTQDGSSTQANDAAPDASPEPAEAQEMREENVERSGAHPSADSGQDPSAGSGQGPSTDPGQLPSTGSGHGGSDPDAQ